MALAPLLIAVAVGLAGCATTPSAAVRPYAAKPPIIASVDAPHRSATLDLVGSEGGKALGFNFNGFAHGDLIVRVPMGWRIIVVYKVDSLLHHSLAIVPWSERTAGSFTDAFPGANIPDPRSGINKKHAAESFSFRAGRAGRYAMVCEVTAHDKLGMWDEFDVVPDLKMPEVLVR